jgi:hypothetical protein
MITANDQAHFVMYSTTINAITDITNKNRIRREYSFKYLSIAEAFFMPHHIQWSPSYST